MGRIGLCWGVCVGGSPDGGMTCVVGGERGTKATTIMCTRPTPEILRLIFLLQFSDFSIPFFSLLFFLLEACPLVYSYALFQCPIIFSALFTSQNFVSRGHSGRYFNDSERTCAKVSIRCGKSILAGIHWIYIYG